MSDKGGNVVPRVFYESIAAIYTTESPYRQFIGQGKPLTRRQRLRLRWWTVRGRVINAIAALRGDWPEYD